ncbi:hypothetical protein [Caulobacter sp. FWC2]|uniref:hypothetical protein n=1 Tax=Caulobacter sp. FWC2 TaxID=69664 RepID=UPI00130460F8|nr:hypothetical protein [Caulobacter sp. FWC2]
MIEAKISFDQVDAAQPAPAKRLPPLLGLGMGAVISVSLWSALALAVSHLL